MRKCKFFILADYDGVCENTMKMCECEDYDKALLAKEAFEMLYKSNPCYSVRIKKIDYYVNDYEK